MPVGGGAYGVDQHPTYNVTEGQDWLLDVVNSVMASNFWDSTAIFITYDEGGGYYDHVPPPVSDGVQLGFRVPLIVISPYSKENYVSHTVMNHGSLLAFINYNWHLPALNQYVADSGLPLDMFNFNSSARTPMILGYMDSFPISPQIPFDGLPYARQGSTTQKLTSINRSLLIENNSTTTPFYESLPFVAAIALIVLVSFIVAIRSRVPRFREEPKQRLLAKL